MVSGRKYWLDKLFVGHAVVSLVVGLIGAVRPNAFEFFLVAHDSDSLGALHPDGEGKVANLFVRLYALLILLQGWIVWQARRIEDSRMRRSLIQGYAVFFSLSALALLRAQVTEGGAMHASNWINIALFLLLACGYAWFALVQPIAVFQGLGKGGA